MKQSFDIKLETGLVYFFVKTGKLKDKSMFEPNARYAEYAAKYMREGQMDRETEGEERGFNKHYIFGSLINHYLQNLGTIHYNDTVYQTSFTSTKLNNKICCI